MYKYIGWYLVSLFILNSLNAQNDLHIVTNNSTNYSIIIPEKPTSIESKAASVLQQYILKISNCKLPIISETNNTSAYQIIIGATKKIKREDTLNLGDDGYLIKSQGNSLILAGGKRKGVLYSVYTFLSDFLNCKYLSVRAIEIPTHNSIILSAPIYKKQIPSFSYRTAHFIEGVNNDYCDWHKLNYFMEDWGLWAHSFKILLPPEQYFVVHPEYFALINSKRVPDQPDLSNPEVLRIVIENLRKMIAAKPAANYWSVSQNDNNNYCQCPNCKKLDDEQGSHQGSLLTFVNAVAKAFPDKIISTLAYNYSLTPPKTLKPEKNVMIVLTTAHDRHVPLKNTPNDSFNKDFHKWSTLTNRIFVWDYIAGFGHALSPFPDLYTLQPNVQYFSMNNASAVFEEGIGTIQGEFSELKCFLVSELLWDKDVDFNSKMRWFVNNYYGKAGGNYILQYIKLLNKNADKSSAKLLAGGSPLDGKSTYLSNYNLNVYKNIFKTALSETGNDTVHALRIKKEYITVLYAELENNKPVTAAQKISFNKTYYSNLLNEWYNNIKKLNITYINEGRKKAGDYYKQYSESINSF